MTRWKTYKCGSCRGYGVVSVYSAEDFLGAGDCECNGGTVSVSENDRLAVYPGGPFLGSWPGKFAELPESALVRNA